MSDHPAIVAQTSVFWRLLLTPVGDLLRGQITGPYERGPRGYRAAIHNAELPQPLADLALDVTRRTRLRRREKTDVARELVAHFRDGLAAGASGDELSAAFGNPVRAAKLIRRAKKRNRSLLWHAWVNTWKAIGAAILLCILLYGVLALRYWTGRPNIQRNYTAELNAPTLAIPESQRAWTVYRQAYLALPAMPQPLWGASQWPAIEPTDAQWPLLVDYVEAAQPSIELIRRASAMPGLGFVLSDAANDVEMMAHGAVIRGNKPFENGPPPHFEPSENPWTINVLMPYLGTLREFARLLAADTRLALSKGDGERVVSDIESLTRIASHAGEHPFLITKLVGVAINAVALDLVGKVLAERPELLSDADLVALAHRIGSLPLEVDLGTERAFFEDLVQRLYSDDGNGDGRLVAGPGMPSFLINETDREIRGGPAAPIVAALAAGRKDLVNEWNRLMGIMRDEAAAPMWTWTSVPGVEEMDRLTASKWYTVRYFPISITVPAIGRVAESSNKAAMRRDATVVAIALELWNRKHGGYPSSLQELTPNSLPAVPTDRFDGGPLKYALHEGRPTVYSVGRDRDDDGGFPPPADGGSQASKWATRNTVRRDLEDTGRAPATDGDWILWPPIKYDAAPPPAPPPE